MNRTANIQTRIDSSTKVKVGKILAKLGLNHSEAINIYYRQIIIRNGIPFNLEIPNDITLDAVNEVKSGRVKKSFKNADELIEDILK